MDELLTTLLDALADGDDAAFSAALAGEDVDLPAVRDQLLDRFNTIRQQNTHTPADVEAARALADAAKRVSGEMQSRQAVLDEAAATMDALASELDPADGQTDQGDGGAAADGGEDDAAGEADTEQITAEENAAEPVLATGAARTRPRAEEIAARLARVSNNAARAVATQRPAGIGLVAAADVPGIPTGQMFPDWSSIAQAAIDRFGAFRGYQPKRDGTTIRHGLAMLNKPTNPLGDISGKSEEAILAILDHAGDEKRLHSRGLVAAGGWCAPSETLYDFCDLATAEGMLDVPEVTASRGGIRHTTGPTFAGTYGADAYWKQTEAEAIANTEKPCFEIDCPSFTDTRLDLVGLCLTAGIPQQSAYPEFVAKWIRDALIAHQHRMNAAKIAGIVAGSTAVTYAAVTQISTQGATSGFLHAVEIQVEDIRHRHRMSQNATIEMVAPQWLRGVFRSDLAKRTGVDLLNVTDAQLEDWMRTRGVRVQWVYDIADFLVSGSGLGAATPATAWPTSVQVLMYPAGTWVAATKPVITLDQGIYDSENIRTNKYTALFSEEGLAMLKRCVDSRRVTIPLCPSGATAIAVDLDCS